MSVAQTTQRLELVSPVVRPAISTFEPAPRLKGLRGARVGLVDNTKTNSDVFLDELYDVLHERHGCASALRVRKPNAAQLPRREDLERLVADTDFVLAGVGD